MMYYKRLPLEGLKNARDLGGYPTSDGGVTRYGIFIRSELPGKHVSGSDIEFLRGMEIAAVLDFRGHEETSRWPDRLAEEKWLSYVNLPLYDAEVVGGNDGRPRLGDNSFSWGTHYINMAKNHMPWVKDVFCEIASRHGPVLLHCTTGKDRTGIISALLLGLCGVSCEDIVADYTVSQIYLRDFYLKIAGTKIQNGKAALSDPFFSTAPENMQTLLTHLKATHGSVRGYLLACGVSEDAMQSITERFVECS